MNLSIVYQGGWCIHAGNMIMVYHSLTAKPKVHYSNESADNS